MFSPNKDINKYDHDPEIMTNQRLPSCNNYDFRSLLCKIEHFKYKIK